MNVTNREFVEVYRARNLPEAHAIRNALDEAGIRVAIDGEQLQAALGELPVGWATAPRVMVEESQVTAAREIIRARQSPSSEGEPGEQTCCLACGRAMDEAATKCSACGWSYQDQGESA